MESWIRQYGFMQFTVQLGGKGYINDFGRTKIIVTCYIHAVHDSAVPESLFKSIIVPQGGAEEVPFDLSNW